MMVQNKGEMDESYWRFYLTGVSGALPGSKENPAPDWMTDKVWADFQLLSHLKGFEGLDDGSSNKPKPT